MAVTMDVRGAGFRLRWRERKPDGGWRSRSYTVHSREAANELAGDIQRALDVGGTWNPPTAAAELPVRELVADLDTIALAWLRARAARCKPGTIDRYTMDLDRMLEDTRAVRGIPSGAPIPATVLSRALVTDLELAWQARGLAPMTIYSGLRIAVKVWQWSADDPDAFPGVPRCPSSTADLLPEKPVYFAPPPPTIAEVDACLAQLSRQALLAFRAGLVMRFTGLRVSQALDIRVGDFCPVTDTLLVRRGKSKREQAMQRRVPVHADLAGWFTLWRQGRSGEDTLIPRRVDFNAAKPMRLQRKPSDALRAAWQAATDAGEARLEVWNPPTRRTARPDHAFRAAFQAHLEGVGVRESVIDYLVGHSTGLRGSHYVSPTMGQLRAAVDQIPGLPLEDQGNVIVL